MLVQAAPAPVETPPAEPAPPLPGPRLRHRRRLHPRSMTTRSRPRRPSRAGRTGRTGGGCAGGAGGCRDVARRCCGIAGRRGCSITGRRGVVSPASRSDAYAEFRRLFDERQYEQALVPARQVVTLTEQQGTGDELQVALMNLAATQSLAADHSGAEASYLRVIELIEAAGTPVGREARACKRRPRGRLSRRRAS